jgi:hypothetical protein
VEPERLGQRNVERGVVIAKVLPQRRLVLDLVEKGTRHPRATKPLL